MENCLYDLLAQLQGAYHSEQKRSYLEQANLKLEHIRLLARLSFDLRLLDKAIHHALIEQVENIGRQLGGWLKSTGAAK